jgi:hypothetical protein
VYGGEFLDSGDVQPRRREGGTLRRWAAALEESSKHRRFNRYSSRSSLILPFNVPIQNSRWRPRAENYRALHAPCLVVQSVIPDRDASDHVVSISPKQQPTIDLVFYFNVSCLCPLLLRGLQVVSHLLMGCRQPAEFNFSRGYNSPILCRRRWLSSKTSNRRLHISSTLLFLAEAELVSIDAKHLG